MTADEVSVRALRPGTSGGGSWESGQSSSESLTEVGPPSRVHVVPCNSYVKMAVGPHATLF